MKMRTILSTVAVLGISAAASQAAFHVMQIQEIIGGVNGNTTAQAIQLRVRAGGQIFSTGYRLRAWDAAGATPILLLTIPSNISNGNAGDNILFTTTSFDSLMSGVSGYAKDFTLTNPIPASYLSGGKVTFEDGGGTVQWSVAFGAYTGTNTGATTNDADGNFSPAFASALPTSSRQGIIFTGLATDPSTNNAANYALTANPATVRNNAGNSFTVVPEPGSIAFVSLGAAALGGMIFARRRR